jgi:hypothetical protein
VIVPTIHGSTEGVDFCRTACRDFIGIEVTEEKHPEIEGLGQDFCEVRGCGESWM